jgi:glycosyltransferase involved in cell wall biosynthesis
MTERLLRILQVSAYDFGGGAENIAWNLFQAYRAGGYGAWLAVGYKQGNDPDVFLVPNDAYRSWWARMWLRIGWLDLRCGYEDFHFPGTRRLLMLTPEPPDIVHCHNLHGGYFDLRVLPWLSQQVPVLLTLHDAWLLSGHCAHSFDCQRWKTGCGHCPDLTIYPDIRRDATAYNWQRKQKIYSKSRLYVATPSRWLMRKVEQSMLAPAIIGARVIPYGIDTSVFHPADRQEARATLNIPQDTRVLLFAANGIRANIWKDYQTLRAAIAMVAEHLHNQDVLFIALGEDAPAEQIGQAEICFVPFQKDPETVARYYQAADVYAHAAKVDTFPNTVLEALACGTPVVATTVGGIPEQIQDGATGFLVPPGASGTMVKRIIQLLADNSLQSRIGTQAADIARKHFDLNRQVDDYLAWYQEIFSTWDSLGPDH